MDFIKSLNEMLDASPRNSRKNAPVLDWFQSGDYGSGRASVISEDKQVGNRISEQFKHKSEHVIFVCYDDKTMETTKRRVSDFIYNELCSVTIIVAEGDHRVNNNSKVFYIHYKNTELINFYKNTFSNLKILDKESENNYRGYFSSSKVNKPFLILAGISGTGKTRFVRKQSEATKKFAETFGLTVSRDDIYCLTSVRPDWHEPSDLLGYISRLGKDGDAEYITTDVLDFIAKAWRAIADSGLTLEVQDSDDLGKRLVVAGERAELDKVLPYWLCLDEMNLAPVEQYFADYLSVLETREWRWEGDGFTYSSDALLKSATIKAVADRDKLRDALGFGSVEDGKYNDLWELICQYGLGIPFNLLVAGTVNMDETTHGFSRKVIDRALSFDFGVFFPNDYDEFFSPKSCNKRLSYPIWSQVTKADLANTIDIDGSQTIAFLTAVNMVLKNTPFELAFRALNELLLAVVSSQPHDELALKAIWDDFMMCKVLPRIEGDSDKLTTADGKEVLVELNTVLAAQLNPVWQADKNDEVNQRPDLYREKVVEEGTIDEGKVLRIPCRSKEKLKWMSERLTNATFTSFWP
ncbi:McrB family protein [Aeromonas caviae]|uniref:McrB family protein n=1 Tax=Aeromonas caviae TaxID=648 RepID=UPI002B474F6C|nr:hypothetical protein [Aeromonas caviae]